MADRYYVNEDDGSIWDASRGCSMEESDVAIALNDGLDRIATLEAELAEAREEVVANVKKAFNEGYWSGRTGTRTASEAYSAYSDALSRRDATKEPPSA